MRRWRSAEKALSTTKRRGGQPGQQQLTGRPAPAVVVTDELMIGKGEGEEMI